MGNLPQNPFRPYPGDEHRLVPTSRKCACGAVIDGKGTKKCTDCHKKSYDEFGKAQALKRLSLRRFPSGATRNHDHDSYDYEGFLSPTALERYGEYMHAHRTQADGSLRASDDWQKGIPQKEYLKSLLRHVMDVWLLFRGGQARDDKETALCAIIFNAQGLLHEELRANRESSPQSQEDNPA